MTATTPVPPPPDGAATAADPTPPPPPGTAGGQRGEPPYAVGDPLQLLTAQLDFARATVLEKTAGLDDATLRTSRLPSGWTPLELLHHLAHVERRWLVWGYLGEAVDDPWGDNDAETGRWRVPDGLGASDVRALFLAQADRSRAIVAAAPGLDAPSALGGRFPSADQAPGLAWILFHLLQEYARHAGHLDIVRELIDGETGE